MDKCIDSNNMLYSIDEYCLLKKQNKHPKEIFCTFCKNKAYIRGENSINRTHFMHTPTCNNVNYKILFGGSGHDKTKEEILDLKLNTVFSSYNIYRYIEETFNISIDITIFLSILEKIEKKQVFKLKSITTTLIPYIWINELGSYNDKLFLYTNSNNISEIWNSDDNQKDIVLCINKNTDKTINRRIIYVDTDLFNSHPSYMTTDFLRSIIPRIFESLNISDLSYDSLIQQMLSICKR